MAADAGFASMSSHAPMKKKKEIRAQDADRNATTINFSLYKTPLNTRCIFRTTREQSKVSHAAQLPLHAAEPARRRQARHDASRRVFDADRAY